MKKRTPDKFWFPWWPDKWIFGSVRIECTPAERGIWVDLLSLASKDDGHIRANEETPYPLQQLAGMLIIPEDELKNAIDKFIKNKKLTKMKTGTLYITKWDKYQFSDRHKRRLVSSISFKEAVVVRDDFKCLYCGIILTDVENIEIDHIIPKTKGGHTSYDNSATSCRKCNKLKSGNMAEDVGFITPKVSKFHVGSAAQILKSNPAKLEIFNVLFNKEVTVEDLNEISMSAESDIYKKSSKSDAYNTINNSKKKKSKINNKKKENPLEKEFEEFWKFYHTIGNKGDDIGDKQEAKKAYKVLRKKESKGNIVKATNGYGGYLKHKELKEGFKQKKMYGSTFLRSRKWERFLTFEYKPSL